MERKPKIGFGAKLKTNRQWTFSFHQPNNLPPSDAAGQEKQTNFVNLGLHQ